MIPIIKSDPLHSQIYSLIKERLMGGFYQPGERLVEVRLAEEFGVSRGPIRESLRMLIQDGLIVGQGTKLHVFNPSLQDMIDIYQCRQGLESLAARLAALHISEEQLEQLFEILRETETAIKREEKETIVKLNIQFHEKIHEASGNHQLISLSSAIRDKVTYLRNCSLKQSFRDNSFLAEHEQIAVALRDRDEDRAGREMHQHIQQDLQALTTLYNKTRR